MADTMEIDGSEPLKSLKRKADDDTLVQAPKRIKVVVLARGVKTRLMTPEGS